MSVVVQAHDLFHAIERMTEILSDKYTKDTTMLVHTQNKSNKTKHKKIS